MGQPMYMIKDITPNLKRWSAKVLVESKGEPRQSSTSPRRFQPLILLDEEGTRVNASIYDSDIAKFENTLNIFQTYTISNAKVCEPKNGVVNNIGRFHWVVNSKTVVNKILNDVIPRRVATPRYVPLSEIVPVRPGSTIDVLAIVIAYFGSRVIQRFVEGRKRRYTVAEFGIVDDRNRPMVLSLWNNVATSEGAQLASLCNTNPVISATKLITSVYYGLSLGSTPNTTISVNPDLSAARKLLSWCSKNPNLKKEHVEAVEAMFRQRRAVVDVNATITPISAADDLVVDTKFTVRGTLRIVEDDQKFFYMSCEECTAPYNAEYNWTIECRTCNQTTRGKPRGVVIIQISDHSGDLNAALFGEEATKMLGRTPHECMELFDAGLEVPLAEINEALEGRTYTLQLKKTLRHTGQVEETRYVVNAMNDGLDAAVGDAPRLNKDNEIGASQPHPSLADLGDSSSQNDVDGFCTPAGGEDSDNPLNQTQVALGVANNFDSDSLDDRVVGERDNSKGKSILDDTGDSSDADEPTQKKLKLAGSGTRGRRRLKHHEDSD